MDVLETLTRVDRVNPLRPLGDRMFAPIRDNFFPWIQFAEPAGDPGFFGPGSAVWYVFEHVPSTGFGLQAAALLETLHPDMAWMGYQYSRALDRKDGVPTGDFHKERMASRAGHTFGFFYSVAMASKPVAERCAAAVRAQHDRVSGERPDGHTFRASDPELLAWNYATMLWGIAKAHERYHPRPLKGAALDEFYAEYTVMGELLGADPIPRTAAEVEEMLNASAPLMGVTIPTVEYLDPWAPRRQPAIVRPLHSLLYWACIDLLPEFGQKILRHRSGPAPVRTARHAIVSALFNGVRYGAGPIQEVRQAHERAAAPAVEAPAPDLVAA